MDQEPISQNVESLEQNAEWLKSIQRAHRRRVHETWPGLPWLIIMGLAALIVMAIKARW